ncbi:hypothetical protein PR048_011865 [Dryococelus australis]|uniref:DDE-1 domain-containing protein n=1 Tax=Dryococelus australis TaxID=614101 RepID=A0ABQ9HN40_9NEOP|nr:hypothetical protein PR048_011865 [Dryococelus australis]
MELLFLEVQTWVAQNSYHSLVLANQSSHVYTTTRKLHGRLGIFFENFLRMTAKNRKILLFTDQCPARLKDLGHLKNVQEEFLPANPPLSLIKALKQRFKRSLILQLLQRLEASEQNCKLSPIDATSMLAMVWHLCSNTRENYKEVGDETWSQIQDKLAISPTFHEFVSADDILSPREEQNDDKMCSEMLSENVDEENDSAVEESKPFPTFSEAILYLDNYSYILIGILDVLESILKNLYYLQK